MLLLLPGVCLSFPLSFHLSLPDDHAVCPFLLPVWVGDAASHFLFYCPSLSPLLSLSFSLSLTHTHCCCCLCPPHLSSYLLPVSSPSPHLFFCSLSHLALYMFMHSRMLHSYTLMHTLQWDIGYGRMRVCWEERERERGEDGGRRKGRIYPPF